jgi:hypothetical protein
MWQMDGVADPVVQRMWDVNAWRRDWIDLLRLSTDHQLSSARALAIQKISFKGSIDKVVMARKYGVQKWLEEGLQELLRRESPPTDEEDELLGWKTIAKLYRIRDRVLAFLCRGEFRCVAV